MTLSSCSLWQVRAQASRRLFLARLSTNWPAACVIIAIVHVQVHVCVCIGTMACLGSCQDGVFGVMKSFEDMREPIDIIGLELKTL